MMHVRHITLPRGFVAAGVRCGIKQADQEDLAIIAVEGGAVPAAVVTTRNQVVGHAVTWCRTIFRRGRGKARAIVINAGNANTCNGPVGWRDAKGMAAETARRLGARAQEILVASTGVIGRPLPMGKVRRGIAAAAKRLGRTNDRAVVRAIMTTDTREKSAVVQSRIGGEPTTVAGIVKGAGMIAPSMATMIGVVTTDAAVTAPALHKALKAAVAGSFNTVTVDSDQSTSDTVAAMAGGAAGNEPLSPRSRYYRKFAAVVAEVCGELARAMAADGEGATKLIEVIVRRARSPRDAEIAAKSVANSPLVKCAVHGADPNWGRVVCALGKSAAKIDPGKLTVKIGGQTVFARGAARRFNVPKAGAHLAGKTVRITCDLGLGSSAYTALTCDLSKQYVQINAEYHT